MKSKMRKQYEHPVVRVLVYETNSVILSGSSIGGGLEGGGDGGEWNAPRYESEE